MDSQKVLVTLATGRQGAATVRLLLQAGVKVNTLVRDKNNPVAFELARMGAEAFEGTMEDYKAVKSAMVGVTNIYLNTVAGLPDPDAEVRTASNVLRAAGEIGNVKSIVLITSLGATHWREWERNHPGQDYVKYYKSKRRVEEVVLASGIQHITILRPTWLMGNYLLPYSQKHFPELRAEQVLGTAHWPQNGHPHIDPGDVGKFAFAALTDPERFSGKQLNLAEAKLTTEEVAATLCKVTGVDVKVKYRSEEEQMVMKPQIPTQTFNHLGNWEDVAALKSPLDEYGIRLTTFQEYVEKNRPAILEALGA